MLVQAIEAKYFSYKYLCFSVDSIPRLLSSSSELELAAEIINNKFKVNSEAQERQDYSSVPDRECQC